MEVRRTRVPRAHMRQRALALPVRWLCGACVRLTGARTLWLTRAVSPRDVMLLGARAWRLQETTALVDGVERFGLGKWAEIKKHTFDETSGRTPVDLKDKWRNLSKALAKAAGCVRVRVHCARCSCGGRRCGVPLSGAREADARVGPRTPRTLAQSLARSSRDAATQRLETEYSPELMQRVRDLIPGNEGGSRARARGAGASGSGGAAAVSRAANGGADAAGRRKRQRKPAAGAVATAAPKAARGLADEDARGGPGGGAGGTAGSMNEVFAQPLLAPHAADVHTAEQLLMPTAGVNGMVDPAMSFILPSI